jgi:hypothetical protein
VPKRQVVVGCGKWGRGLVWGRDPSLIPWAEESWRSPLVGTYRLSVVGGREGAVCDCAVFRNNRHVQDRELADG